jgi:hypothetical protein
MKKYLYIISFYFFIFISNISYCQDYSIIENKNGYNIIQLDGIYHLEYIDSSFLYTNFDTICNALNNLKNLYKKSNIALPRYLKLLKFDKSNLLNQRDIKSTALKNSPGSIIFQLGAFDIEKSTYMYYISKKNRQCLKKAKLLKCIQPDD